MKPIYSLFNVLTAMMFAFLVGIFMFSVAGFTPQVVLYAGFAFSLTVFISKSKNGALNTGASPDIDAIAKYAISNKIQLLRNYFNSMAIANDIMLFENVKNKLPLPRLSFSAKPRPYTGNFTPTAGDLKYTDRELDVNDFQRDLFLDPRKYRNTYLASQRPTGEGANANVIPFPQYTMQVFLGENAAAMNNSTAFFGLGKAAFSDFNPASTYASGALVKFTGTDGEPHYYKANAATSAAESPSTTPAKWDNVDELAITEGLGTKIKTARDASTITNVAATGAFDSTNGFAQALSVYRKLPEAVRNQASDLYLYASSDNMDKIQDSFGDNIQKYTAADGTLQVLPRTDGKLKLKRASWMSGSNMVIVSPKSNLGMGTDALGDFNDMNIIKDVYGLKIGLTGLLGFQFGDETVMAINDQN